jgi:hypothetical protein
MARANVYVMMEADKAEEHRATLHKLDELRIFAGVESDAGERDEKVIYGLYNKGDVLDENGDDTAVAMAGGISSPGTRSVLTPFGQGSLKISAIHVNPKDRRKPSEYGVPAMEQALEDMAKFLSLKLEIDLDTGTKGPGGKPTKDGDS